MNKRAQLSSHSKKFIRQLNVLSHISRDVARSFKFESVCFNYYLCKMKQIENTNYYVTEEGNVINNKTQKILKPMTISGYHYVSILGKKRSIHSLVAKCYLIKENDRFEINHKDGNRLNNHYSNLEYLSHVENMRHAYKNGLISIESRKENAEAARKIYKNKTNRHTAAKLTKDQVLEIKELLKQKIKQKDIAKKYGVSRTPISHINSGKSWKHI